MRGDLVTELVELVNAYHWRWAIVHGNHGIDCDLCHGLHERHAWVLAAITRYPDLEPETVELEVVA